MTEYGVPFDGILTGDASVAPYSATEWARYWMLRHGVGDLFKNYGVLKGTGDSTHEGLQVDQFVPASTNVQVQVGAALVNGHLYENTAAVTLAVAANVSGNPRIDTVILRLDYTAQTIRLVIKQGTPAGSPVRPALTQNTSTWEIPLADIAVANGFSVINDVDITPRGRAVNLSTLGWIPYAYPLGGQPLGAVSASSISPSVGNGLAVPIYVPGNMLLQSLAFRGSGTFQVEFGLYIQDLNDGNTAENTLRRVAQGSGSGVAGGTANNVANFFAPAIYLPPGIYWLVMRNAGSLTITTYVPTDFEASVNRGMNHPSAISPTKTLDMVTGWSTKFSDVLMVRLQGRVFGQTTAF